MKFNFPPFQTAKKPLKCTMRRTSLRKTSEIRAYLDKGLSVRQVADLTGVCKTTVHKYKQEHMVAPCTHRGGRPIKLTGRMSRTVISENGLKGLIREKGLFKHVLKKNTLKNAKRRN